MANLMHEEGKGESHEVHEASAQKLTHAIQVGKREVPENPAPLVCKPQELESWRVFKIMSEFVSGFELISKYGLAASFFGSARTGADDRYYREAKVLSAQLAKNGFAVITGGSAGVMQAANEGAFEAGGASIGLNIHLSDNQGLNDFLTESYTFDHFFVRKVMLAYSSDVYIFFPGGYGTLDEFFEMVTLVQTQKIKRIPIVLYGSEYWIPLEQYMKEFLYERFKAISQSDFDLYRIVDSVDEAMQYITPNVKC